MPGDDIEFQILNKCYRVTREWATTQHPGGVLVLDHTHGKDATAAFFALHPHGTESRLAAFAISRGNTPSVESSALQHAFIKLHQQLVIDGQMEVEWSYYHRQAACLGVLFVSAWSFLLLFGSPIVASLCLGIFWQQLAFIGHDIGHNESLFPHGNWMVTLLFGVSIGWWKATHNVHHLVTNEQEHDPDIQHLPVLCLDERAFRGYYSTYARRSFAMGRVARWLVSCQHWLFYPIMCLARINLYAQSVIFLASPRFARERSRFRLRATLYEAAALFGFWLWHGAWLFTSWKYDGTCTMVLCLLLSHAVAGLTHLQITLSHFAQPILAADGSCRSATTCWIRNAINTSLDISCNSWMDWLHGGLHFQVLHHLFPRLARHRLRHVNELYLRPFLRQHHLEYHSASFLRANQAILSVLEKTAKAAQKFSPPCSCTTHTHGLDLATCCHRKMSSGGSMPMLDYNLKELEGIDPAQVNRAHIESLLRDVHLECCALRPGPVRESYESRYQVQRKRFQAVTRKATSDSVSTSAAAIADTQRSSLAQLRRARADISEAERTGQETLHELARQKHVIDDARKNTQETIDSLSMSQRALKRMSAWWRR